MLFDSNHCPADLSDAAEAYVMNRLDPADAAIFEEHLLICGRCIAAVEEANQYGRAMKVAAQRLRPRVARATAGN